VAPSTDLPITGAWVADRPSEESWAVLAENARAARKPWADEFAALSRNVAALAEITAGVASDRIIGNRDIQPGTVHFGPGNDLVVTHWDFAGPTTKETELAGLLASVALHSADIGRAVVSGYRDRSGGDVPALTLSSFAGAVTGWLTWANHRACGATSTDVSTEELAYNERSLREVLDDPLTVDHLEALIEAVAP
jgi:hypothetical protein